MAVLATPWPILQFISPFKIKVVLHAPTELFFLRKFTLLLPHCQKWCATSCLDCNFLFEKFSYMQNKPLHIPVWNRLSFATAHKVMEPSFFCWFWFVGMALGPDTSVLTWRPLVHEGVILGGCRFSLCAFRTASDSQGHHCRLLHQCSTFFCVYETSSDRTSKPTGLQRMDV